jgi:hypothetical protein
VTVPIVHPRFVASVPVGFFPARCRIEAETTTYDDHGQEIETFAPVVDWEAIPAAKAPLSAEERAAARYTATDRVWHVLLRGAYPEITTAHRAVIGGETFDIDAAETDQSGSVTRLRVRQITT